MEPFMLVSTEWQEGRRGVAGWGKKERRAEGGRGEGRREETGKMSRERGDRRAEEGAWGAKWKRVGVEVQDHDMMETGRRSEKEGGVTEHGGSV
eukprot:760184-Hanusia_phi.AAC.2